MAPPGHARARRSAHAQTQLVLLLLEVELRGRRPDSPAQPPPASFSSPACKVCWSAAPARVHLSQVCAPPHPPSLRIRSSRATVHVAGQSCCGGCSAQAHHTQQRQRSPPRRSRAPPPPQFTSSPQFSLSLGTRPWRLYGPGRHGQLSKAPHTRPRRQAIVDESPWGRRPLGRAAHAKARPPTAHGRAAPKQPPRAPHPELGRSGRPAAGPPTARPARLHPALHLLTSANVCASGPPARLKSQTS